MQAEFEKSLFAVAERTESKLLQLEPDQYEEAIDLFLQLPAVNDHTVLEELRRMLAILTFATRNFHAPQGQPYSTVLDAYTRAYSLCLDNQLSKGGLLERLTGQVREAVAKRKSLQEIPRPEPIWEPLNLEEISSCITLTENERKSNEIEDLAMAFERLDNSNLGRDQTLKTRAASPMKRPLVAVTNTAEDFDQDTIEPTKSDFITAKHQLSIEAAKKGKFGPCNQNSSVQPSTCGAPARKTLGATRRRGFIPPLKTRENEQPDDVAKDITKRVLHGAQAATAGDSETLQVDERLRNIDPKMIETIQNEIMDNAPKIQWDDIAGLKHAKKSIKEMVIWPMLRPDIFTGLRRAPKGLLLFGPPGTGKTMIGKCIASTAECTFFSISASSLTSKWVGEGEKMVRALFAVARVHQPSVIFIDEIDSLLTQRTDGEFEASRRIKTEFLIQFDGAHIQNPDEDRILLIGATNRPQELDEAARRRLIKRFYIPLPDREARQYIINNLLKKQTHRLTENDIITVSDRTKGYSGSDMDGLCREAALGPIREIQDISMIPLDSVRPIELKDFDYALTQVRASVSDKDLDLYQQWNQNYGSLPDCFERET